MGKQKNWQGDGSPQEEHYNNVIDFEGLSCHTIPTMMMLIMRWSRYGPVIDVVGEF